VENNVSYLQLAHYSERGADWHLTRENEQLHHVTTDYRTARDMLMAGLGSAELEPLFLEIERVGETVFLSRWASAQGEWHLLHWSGWGWVHEHAATPGAALRWVVNAAWATC
jgi:hypothetical protein